MGTLGVCDCSERVNIRHPHHNDNQDNDNSNAKDNSDTNDIRNGNYESKIINMIMTKIIMILILTMLIMIIIIIVITVLMIMIVSIMIVIFHLLQWSFLVRQAISSFFFSKSLMCREWPSTGNARELNT